MIPRLYAIVDADVSADAGWSVPALASLYLQAGVRLLQVRAKHASARDVLAWVDTIAEQAPGDARIVVNDRVDIALAAGTHHVHLGQDDLPPADARALLGEHALIGWSTHTPAQMAAATAMPIGYLAIGPVFSTATKDTGYDGVGLTRVAEARAVAHPAGLPVVAIGGITLDTAPDVIAAGADAVAIITDLVRAGDPGARAAAYLDRLSRV